MVKDTRYSLTKELFGLASSSCGVSLDMRFNSTPRVLGYKEVSNYLQQEVGEELWDTVRCRISPQKWEARIVDAVKRLVFLEDTEELPFCSRRKGKEDLPTGSGSPKAMFAWCYSELKLLC